MVSANAAAPVIHNPPRGLQVIVDQPAGFGVIANGTAPLAYEWRKDGVAIPGATNDQLFIERPRVQDSGLYSVAVYNTEGSVTSPDAVLIVDAPLGGELDHSWGWGNSVQIPKFYLGPTIQSLFVQADSKIIVGGYFTPPPNSPSGLGPGWVARLNADGRVDPNFLTGLSSSNALLRNLASVEAIGVQRDGKVVVGGSFRKVSGVNVEHYYLVRLNSDGTLDNSFRNGQFGPNGPVQSMALLSDDQILIGGFFTAVDGRPRGGIARVNADGTIDASFADGLPGADNWVNALALQSDGKILIGGRFTAINGISRGRVARLNADGTLDLEFGNGLAGADDEVSSVALQNDGKVLIGGRFRTVNGVTRNRLARLNVDGSLDNDFGDDLLGPDNIVDSIALQNDGKVLIGGSFTTFNGLSARALARLNENGTLDTTFTNGHAGVEGVSGIVALNDGKLVFANYAFGKSTLARLNPDGSLDTAFKNGFPGADNVVWATAIQSDGKVLVGGEFGAINGLSRNRIARLTADGVVDESFATGLSGADGTVESIAIQNDGKVLISGAFTNINGALRGRVARLNEDGSMDTDFANALSGANSNVSAVIVQGDGKILIGGRFTAVNEMVRNRIARLNADGTLDPEFGEQSFGANGAISSLALQTDGKLLIGGAFTEIDGQSRNRIARLNADGTLDDTFANGLSGANNTVESISIQNDGKVLIAGYFTTIHGINAGRVARLNEDGTIDTTFGNTLAGANAAILSIATQSDGKVLIGGEFTAVNGSTNRNRIAQLNSDGSLDAGFSQGQSGVDSPSGVFPGPFVSSLVLQNDKVIIGGRFNIVNDFQAFSITRLWGRGTPGNQTVILHQPVDFTIGVSGAGPFTFQWRKNGVPIPGATNDHFSLPHARFSDIGLYSVIVSDGNESVISRDATLTVTSPRDGDIDLAWPTNFPGSAYVYSIAVQNDGKVLIAGNIQGVTRVRLERMNVDGTVDASFTNGLSGAIGSIESVVLESNGKILIGGSFSGTSRNRIARLNPDGSLDNSFGNGLSGANDTVGSIALQADGKVIIGGRFGTVNGATRTRIARLNSDGTIDPDFTAGLGSPGAVLPSIAIQPDGRILVGGDFTTVNGTNRGRIARLNDDGSVDHDFGNGLSGANGPVTSVALQSDGKVLIGGSFTIVNGVPCNRIARLNMNGTVDPAFNNGLSGANNTVESIVIDSKGDLLIGGLFTAVNGVGRNRIARLRPSGAVDDTFGDGHLLANSTVLTVTSRSDGKIFIGGEFTMVNGIRSPFFASLWGRPPFHVENLTRTNDVATLVLHLLGGTTNRIQYTTNLGDTLWFDLPGDIVMPGISGLINKSDSTIGGSSQRYYRVRQIP